MMHKYRKEISQNTKPFLVSLWDQIDMMECEECFSQKKTHCLDLGQLISQFWSTMPHWRENITKSRTCSIFDKKIVNQKRYGTSWGMVVLVAIWKNWFFRAEGLQSSKCMFTNHSSHKPFPTGTSLLLKINNLIAKKMLKWKEWVN
jgi:hypothetical protein